MRLFPLTRTYPPLKSPAASERVWHRVGRRRHDPVTRGRRAGTVRLRLHRLRVCVLHPNRATAPDPHHPRRLRRRPSWIEAGEVCGRFWGACASWGGKSRRCEHNLIMRCLRIRRRSSGIRRAGRARCAKPNRWPDAPQFDRALRDLLRAAGCALVRQGKGPMKSRTARSRGSKGQAVCRDQEEDWSILKLNRHPLNAAIFSSDRAGVLPLRRQ